MGVIGRAMGWVSPGLVVAVGLFPGSVSGEDRVSYHLPEDAAARERVQRAGAWLVGHVVPVRLPGQDVAFHLVAWKDPTLEPGDPRLLAGYVITDTLWASRALRPLEPAVAGRLEAATRRLGWPGNGLHEVLFEPVEPIRHRPIDADLVHGHSLGLARLEDGRTVDVRVFREAADPAFEIGHPALFAEHAVYQALHEHWRGDAEAARDRLRRLLPHSRPADPSVQIFWDPGLRVLVDAVTLDDWRDCIGGRRAGCRQYTFKLGTLLYAIRVTGLEPELGSRLQPLRESLWRAQRPDGGLAHFVDIAADGTFEPTTADATGEASAIAILTETVRPAPLRAAAP
jgi:hypothetical protein